MRYGKQALVHVMGLVMAEVERAKEKHGSNSVSLLPQRNGLDAPLLRAASSVGTMARMYCEEGHLTQFAVLMEEVGEVADALLRGEDTSEELVQVTAMALSMRMRLEGGSGGVRLVEDGRDGVGRAHGSDTGGAGTVLAEEGAGR